MAREITIHLSDPECAALDRFTSSHPGDLSHEAAAHILLREALIGMGDLASDAALPED
jgi:hypothetical protein